MIPLARGVAILDAHTRLTRLQRGDPRNAALGTAVVVGCRQMMFYLHPAIKSKMKLPKYQKLSARVMCNGAYIKNIMCGKEREQMYDVKYHTRRRTTCIRIYIHIQDR